MVLTTAQRTTHKVPKSPKTAFAVHNMFSSPSYKAATLFILMLPKIQFSTRNCDPWNLLWIYPSTSSP